jgi:hypothetical protein
LPMWCFKRERTSYCRMQRSDQAWSNRCSDE